MNPFEPKPSSLHLKSEDPDKKKHTELKLVKATMGLGHDLAKGHPEKALQKAIVTGIKLANDGLFKTATAHPLQLLEELKKLGIKALAWAPETLFAEIDRKYHGWSHERVTTALTRWHETGLLDTDVNPLVRQKLFALRVLMTSDTAYNQWHIFEKVGSVFNDRIPQFGVMEPLTAAEASVTVALMDKIRPDTFSNEVKIYIAATCQQDALLTVEVLDTLKMVENQLQIMNFDSCGERLSK